MTVAAVIPPQPRGAVKSWRKLIRAVQPGAGSAFGLDGSFLSPGLAYELPEGALIITCDQYEKRRVITVMRAGDSALDVIKAWEMKGPLGKRAADWVRRRLDAAAPAHRAVLIEEEPNRYEGRCPQCRNPVPAGAGHARRDGRTGRWRAYHRRGQCPPPPPLPQRVEPNYRGGPCFRCGGWVEREEGSAILTCTPAPGEKPEYAPVHGGDCPPVPAEGPANQREGWCGRCGELLSPGEGCWQERDDNPARMMLACHPACRTPGPATPSWTVRVHDGTPRDGDVILARAAPWSGPAPVPQAAPGYRLLPGGTGLVQFAAVILRTVTGPHGGTRARVRVADIEEAAPLLAQDAAALAAAAPFELGFMAQWTAAQYLDRRPWLAEVTGYDPTYGYQRKFLRPRHDWRTATGRRGHRMDYCWTLRLNKVYEAWWPDGSRRSGRAFLRATPDGDVTEISEEEVTGWLALLVPPAAP